MKVVYTVYVDLLSLINDVMFFRARRGCKDKDTLSN